MSKTKIEWADKTWNPIIGCSKISRGCDNCYAEKMATRLMNMESRGYLDSDIVRNESGWTGKTAFIESELEKPLHWRNPSRIFVCSMGDLFHISVATRHQMEVFETMRRAYWHTFILLTKRPRNMQDFLWELQANKGSDFIRWPLPNVFLGVTAENQEEADIRIPILMEIPAAVRFVSVEPMLGPVNLWSWLPGCLDFSYTSPPARLGWVICGGESGPKARPMHPDWALGLRNQCAAAKTPFFFKQWGEYLHGTQDNGSLAGFKGAWAWAGDGKTAKIVARVGKKKAGRLLDGVTHDEYPNPNDE